MANEGRKVKLSPSEEAELEQAFTDPRYRRQPIGGGYEQKTSLEILRELIKRAKAHFSLEFGGANPDSNQLGFAPLQPHHVGGSTTWVANYGSTGWESYDSGSNNHPMADTTIPKDTFVGWWGWEDRDAIPKVIAIQPTIGQKELVIDYMRDIQVNPDHRVMLQEPVVLLPQSTYKMKVDIDLVGDSELVPIGWVVTTGAKLAKESYYD